jgi:hypothetical protein
MRLPPRGEWGLEGIQDWPCSAPLRSKSYNQNLWMHHLTGGATYLPL